nr:unnamed protein product [Spirometra erinaceieuropaei]
MQDGIVEVDEEDALVDTTSTNGTFTSALVVALILVFLYFLLLLMNWLAAAAAKRATRGTNRTHDEAMQEARRRLQERFNQTNQRQTSAENAPSSSNVTDGESAKISEGSRPKPKATADLLKQSGYNPLMGDDTDKPLQGVVAADDLSVNVPSKLKLLRTNLGELGQRYFDALNLQKAIDLQTTFSKLDSAWGGKDNVFLSRYQFLQMRQESNQCVSDFITNLTLAIQDCGYKEIKADNFEHAMLVQQLIFGLRDEKARENLLSEKKDLSWEKACDIASNQERIAAKPSAAESVKR